MVKRALTVLREEGPRTLWFKVLGETVYRRALLMQLDLCTVPEERPSGVPVEIAELAGADVDDYLALRADADAGLFHARLAAGQRCFAARHDGRLVHAVWAAVGQVRIDYLSRMIQVAPDEVYLYDMFTVPEFRRLNIAVRRSDRSARVLFEAGYRRALAVVVPENTPGVRQTAKAGYRAVGVMGHVKVGPFAWHFWRRTGNDRRPQ